MDPELQALLAALGVSNVADAQKAISSFNAFLTDARVATATQSLSEAQAAVQTNSALIRQLEAATGKKGGDVLAVALAWKQGADSAAALRTELDNIKKATTGKEAKDKLDGAIAAGRLAPANREKVEKLFNDFGMSALDTYLDALPQAVAPQDNGTAPKAPPSNGATGGPLTNIEREVSAQLGLSEAEAAEFKAKHGRAA